ncbi:hypothetical protein C8F01DRAFT_1319194 [Mycena amicta]|nr:hypothetical protein C8F01DRAFT_1319194 [Mycena amicta]
MSSIPKFSGDYAVDNIAPADWLRSACSCYRERGWTTSLQKMDDVKDRFISGSIADNWFKDLSAAQRTDWAAFEAAFEDRFQAIPTVTKPKAQLVDELSRMQPRLLLPRRDVLRSSLTGAPTSVQDLARNHPPLSAHRSPIPTASSSTGNLQEQHFPVGDVLRLAQGYNAGFHFVKGVWGPHAIKVGYAGDALNRAAGDLQRTEFIARLADDRYRGLCSSLLYQRFGNVLTLFKDAAVPTVNRTYLISHHMGDAAKDLLKCLAYIYTKSPDTFDPATGLIVVNPTPKKAYENPAILQVITNACFTKSTIGKQIMQRLPRHEGQIEMPAPLVAIAAAAIHSAIDDWKTGAHLKTTFDSRRLLDTYNTHVGLLGELLAKNPVRYHNTMTALFPNASGGISVAAAPSASHQEARMFISFAD